MADVLLTDNGATTTVVGRTEGGDEFVDSWIHGVLSVEDAGRITVTSEVIDELRQAVEQNGLVSRCAVGRGPTNEGDNA